MEGLAKRSFWNTFWSFLDQVFTKCNAFVIGIILARLLTPDDFGMIGMLMVFISLSDVFVESGVSNALVRKLDRDELDCSTAFVVNLLLSVSAYGVLFVSSPYIADFYGEPLLTDLIKVIGINILFYALCIVPNALIIAKFKVKFQTRVNVCANVSAGVLAIFLAYCGAGVWALAAQSIMTNVVKTVGYWICAKYIPSFKVSRKSLSYFCSYGSKSLAVGLLGSLFNNIYNLLIGKFFSKYELGLFARASQFGQVPTSIVMSTFQKVSIATFSELQNEKDKLVLVYRKYIHCISFFMFPLLLAMSALAKPMILVLLTEKWIECVPMLRIVCVGLAFSPLGIINICLLQSMNKMSYLLRLEILKKIVYALIIMVSFPMGLIAMVLGAAVYNILGTLMNLSCSKKFLGYSYFSQICDFGKYFVAAAVSGATTIMLLPMVNSLYIQLLCGLFVFAGCYILICFVLKFEAISYIKNLRGKVL